MDLEADPDSLLGQVVASRYLVEARLGHGAMGTVYRARHIKVGRAFAVKVLHPQFLTEDKARRRFAREAELAGSLQHPNIVSVVDAGETPEGLRYIVMEYVEGTTLFELINESAPMPAPRVLSIVRQLCDGLAHAHERELIHRDFKTENVLVERDARRGDVPKIVDFGIAILRDEAASSSPDRLTTAGLVLGTPHYMAPEHATGSAIDHRIDLFALGVMCFEMLTGRPPFDGDGVDVARANLLADTPVMSVRVPGLQVDPLLEALTRKLMMKSRDARPPSARAVRELIDLIERDRLAAAATLGVVLEHERATSRGLADSMAIPQLLPERPQSSRYVLSGPVATDPTQLAMDSAAITGLRPASMHATAALSEPHQAPWASAPPPREMSSLRIAPWVDTEQMPPVASRHRALAVAAVAGLFVIAALILAIRTRGGPAPTPTATILPALPAAPRDAGADAAQPSPMASVPEPPFSEPVATEPPLVEPPGRTVAKPARAAARPAAPGKASPAAPSVEPPRAEPAPPAVAAVEPPVQAPAASPIADDKPTESHLELSPVHAPPPAQANAPATPASVAQLYAAVGKQLKALDQARGSAATADLWLLYLRVRINDVIANPVKCAEAEALLRHLDDEVVRRSR
ncbi:MAG TPA: protein kinase [Kofleriaceae bacterium]|nr:protein kinase [Kofleriaceae bacterium]